MPYPCEHIKLPVHPHGLDQLCGACRSVIHVCRKFKDLPTWFTPPLNITFRGYKEKVGTSVIEDLIVQTDRVHLIKSGFWGNSFLDYLMMVNKVRRNYEPKP